MRNEEREKNVKKNVEKKSNVTASAVNVGTCLHMYATSPITLSVNLSWPKKRDEIIHPQKNHVHSFITT